MNDFERIKNSKQINAPDFVVPKGRSQSRNQSVNSTPHPQPMPAQPKPKPNGILGLLDLQNMAMDADRSVILMMLALLSGKGEETDELLIMALLYIML